jgi:hypothetical protein
VFNALAEVAGSVGSMGGSSEPTPAENITLPQAQPQPSSTPQQQQPSGTQWGQ